MRFHVIRSTLDVNAAARRLCFDAAAWMGHLYGAGESTYAHVASRVRNAHAARSAGDADVVANVICGDGTAGRFELRITIDFLDPNRTRSCLDIHGTAHPANCLRTGRNAGADFGVMRD